MGECEVGTTQKRYSRPDWHTFGLTSGHVHVHVTVNVSIGAGSCGGDGERTSRKPSERSVGLRCSST
ncbi:unnamed protein product [Protopolystoma xenopodis]|uniref:Uncharacterized protein n=1 Tax=Protopolystoma xenopodis TaxID=117903 RepID=A0A3S5AEX1_9PLAT|nr:unnamed protein product [Protopolystoma xenopodis]